MIRVGRNNHRGWIPQEDAPWSSGLKKKHQSAGSVWVLGWSFPVTLIPKRRSISSDPGVVTAAVRQHGKRLYCHFQSLGVWSENPQEKSNWDACQSSETWHSWKGPRLRNARKNISEALVGVIIKTLKLYFICRAWNVCGTTSRNPMIWRSTALYSIAALKHRGGRIIMLHATNQAFSQAPAFSFSFH